jgi:hypothetical protein
LNNLKREWVAIPGGLRGFRGENVIEQLTVAEPGQRVGSRGLPRVLQTALEKVDLVPVALELDFELFHAIAHQLGLALQLADQGDELGRIDIGAEIAAERREALAVVPGLRGGETELTGYLVDEAGDTLADLFDFAGTGDAAAIGTTEFGRVLGREALGRLVDPGDGAAENRVGTALMQIPNGEVLGRGWNPSRLHRHQGLFGQPAGGRRCHLLHRVFPHCLVVPTRHILGRKNVGTVNIVALAPALATRLVRQPW